MKWNSIISHLAIIVSSLCATDAFAQIYPEGMIAYWKFDEGSGSYAYSSVGQHTGTVSGPAWTAGQVGGALYFEGTPLPRTPEYNDFVVVPHDADLNVPGNEISIEAWVNFMGEVGAWDHQIVSKTASYASFGYQLRLANGLLAIAIFNGQNPTGSCCLSTTFQMPYDWRHVVGIYSDAQDLARLYMDGELVAENTSFTTVLNNSGNTSDLFIGKWNSGADPHEWHLWKGTIDEVAIYNRILLPDEITEHYQNGLNGRGYEIRIIPIAIDIKPGSYPNSINPKSKGVIPVAILSTPTFNATTVDPLSVRFGPNNAMESHGRGHSEDVDHDGDLDMMLHFSTQEAGIQCGATQASLTGQTTNGLSITGTDAIVTVGCGLGKDAVAGDVPLTWGLEQNHPNPFNPSTTVSYALPVNADVSLIVYDVLGRKVTTLVAGQAIAGRYDLVFDASSLSSGIYFYRLMATGDNGTSFTRVNRMILMK